MVHVVLFTAYSLNTPMFYSLTEMSVGEPFSSPGEFQGKFSLLRTPIIMNKQWICSFALSLKYRRLVISIIKTVFVSAVSLQKSVPNKFINEN